MSEIGTALPFNNYLFEESRIIASSIKLNLSRGSFGFLASYLVVITNKCTDRKNKNRTGKRGKLTEKQSPGKVIRIYSAITLLTL